MLNSAEPKRIRKGTKSCKNCRRRRVRCVWTSREATECRQCEEREVSCESQTMSLASSQSDRRTTSQRRLQKLESEVRVLSEIACSLEQKLFDQSKEYPRASTFVSDEKIQFGDSFGASDMSEEYWPLPLSNVSKNQALNLGSYTIAQYDLEEDRSIVPVHLCDAARRIMQSLIPTWDKTKQISNFATEWLATLSHLFPSTGILEAGRDLLSMREQMQQTDVDPIALAQWLLVVALTLQQIPPYQLDPNAQAEAFTETSDFCIAVTLAYERSILQYDSLVGTVDGLSASMMYLRLMMSRGSFQQLWLQLRRLIAVAELVGLAEAAKVCHTGHYPGLGSAEDPNILIKSHIWDALCSIDRISAMVHNAPIGTKRYRSFSRQDVVVNGQVQLHHYFGCLGEMIAKIQELEGIEMKAGVAAEHYGGVLRLDSDLRQLANLPPQEWWRYTQTCVGHPSQILQFWHECLVMRLHLPFNLRPDTRREFAYSRTRGTEACRSILYRYLKLRHELSPGVFFLRVLDLQALVAGTVLLLVNHWATSDDAEEQQNISSDTKTLLPRVIATMEEKATGVLASDCARQGARILLSLLKLCKTTDPSSPDTAWTCLRVPILGEITVKQDLRVPHLHRLSVSTPFVGSNQWPSFSPPSMAPSSTAPTMSDEDYTVCTSIDLPLISNDFPWSTPDTAEPISQLPNFVGEFQYPLEWHTVQHSS